MTEEKRDFIVEKLKQRGRDAKMEKLMYITLDPLLPGVGEEEHLLEKKVDESYLDKTFGDLIQKLLDPEADEYNSAYNANDRNLAAYIQSWFNEMNANPDSIQVGIVAIIKDESPQEITVALNDMVSEYSSRMVLKRVEKENASGQTKLYNSIELAVATNVSNAPSRPYTLSEINGDKEVISRVQNVHQNILNQKDGQFIEQLKLQVSKRMTLRQQNKVFMLLVALLK